MMPLPIRWRLRLFQLGLDLLDGRQRALELLGKLFEVPELRDSHRRRRVPERVFRDDPILRLAQNKADARLVVGMAEKIVNGGEVEVHLPRVLWLERRHLQLNDAEA